MNATEKTMNLVAAMRWVASTTTSPDVAHRYAAGAIAILKRAGLDEPEVQASDLVEDDIQVWTMRVSGDAGLGRARVDALAKIATAHGCQCLTDGDDDTDQERYLIVVGVTSAVTFLQIMMPMILIRMEVEAASCTAMDRASFLIGWGLGLAEKIHAAVSAAVDSIPDGASLAARNAARIVARIDSLFPDSTPGESPLVEIEGFAAGWNAGQDDEIDVSRIQV